MTLKAPPKEPLPPPRPEPDPLRPLKEGDRKP